MVVLGGLLLWGLSHAESAVGFCRMSLISVFVSSALGLLWPCGPNGAFHCCQVDTTAPCAQAARTTPTFFAPMAPLCFAGSAAQAMGHRGQRSSGSASTVNVAKSGAHLIIIMRIKIIIIIIIVFFYHIFVL